MTELVDAASSQEAMMDGKKLKVKPLDIAAVIRDAFLAGAGMDTASKEAQRIPDDIMERLYAYDPEHVPAYHRLAALHSEALNRRTPASGEADLVAALREALAVLCDAVGRYQAIGPLKGVRKDLAKGLEMGLRALDPDLGRIRPGHVCKHSIRWPHPCDECDRAALTKGPTHAG